MRAYYAATIVFLFLDYVFDVNVRIAFFESSTALRTAYYGVCFACLALMLWRPAWTVIISAFESLMTLSALIISFGMRVILISDSVLQGYGSVVTLSEVINFLMSGSIAYIAWSHGMSELQKKLHD